MIDIHTHIIPEFDDGSRSLVESHGIARFEANGGTKFLIATPHVENELAVRNSGVIVDKVERLNADFRENDISVKVVPGAELFPAKFILGGLDKGLPITLAGSGKYVLLDLPHSVLPNDFDDILFEIQTRGVTPILAHPERCPAFQSEPENIVPYRERGIVFQLNMASFGGRHGAVAKTCAEAIFKARGAHFLASDAHRKRSFNLGEIADQLRIIDPDYVELLTVSSGHAVLSGEPLPDLPIPELQKRKPSWLSRFFSVA